MTSDLEAYGPPFRTFRIPYMRGARFELRPVSAGAPAKTVAIMYRLEGTTLTQCGVGSLDAGGTWNGSNGQALDPAGLHWCAHVDEPR